MLYRAPDSGSQPRRGVVLIAVLVVVVLLTLAAYQYSELMLAEYKATSAFNKANQARALANSGIDYAAMLLSDKNAFQSVLNGNPYDNPTAFKAISVSGETSRGRKAYFSVVSPYGPDDEAPGGTGAWRYGATDESGKINVNALLQLDSSGSVAVQMLVKLGMDEETANAVLDWIDTDSTVRPGGAEDETYGPLGYHAKNGPIDTLEELLYVQGVTPELLFGNDRNRNGFLDSDDQQGTGGVRDLGLQAYLTVYSREQNVDHEGNPRIYINTRNTITLFSKLTDAIGPDMTNYLLAYRRFGPAPEQIPRETRTVKIPAADIQRNQLQLQSGLLGGRGAGGRNIASLFELIDTRILIPGAPNQPSLLVECPLNDLSQVGTLLPLVMDKLTTNSEQDLPARINVLTAPRAVLAALPGLTEKDVSDIISARQAAEEALDPIYMTPAWLLTEAQLKPATLRTLDRFVTSRTQVYRVQVVGHFEGGGPNVRVEAIIDTNRGRPRIVYWRDLSELGKGFNLNAPGERDR